MFRRFRFALVAVFLVSLSSSAIGGNDVTRLSRQLSQDKDFRMRVQAALELGKSADGRALQPLYKALRDPSAAVRAAAAAALKTLGDPAALPELAKHNGDENESVRRQVAGAIWALKAQKTRDEDRRRYAKVLVKLGKLHNGTNVSSSQALFAVKKASRSELDRLPGIAVLNASEDVEGAAAAHRLPVVLLTGSIRQLDATKEGSEFVYSAAVDYVVHRMPDQSIVATVTGRAQARASEVEVRDRKRREALRLEVIDAAVASAIQRTPRALLAAAD
ncbi:MAG: HEAT repeat domain-containing protein [Myxococcales bacterium]|jgi:hypothetical protein|nr:HEAT repeat domain-containing protein [Myxococcales bacterium]